ncbi:MAG: hypothetical protein KDK27_15400, partial [Leptospiraceae bacterium]|nr:hypothetical protein [Leptospiraceae bacterium]
MSGMNVVVKISRILVLVLFCLLLASNLSCHINDNHDNDDRDNLILLVLLYLFSGTNPASNPEGSLVDTVEDGAAKTNYIFSNVNFGTAASDRLLVIFVNGQRDVG